MFVYVYAFMFMLRLTPMRGAQPIDLGAADGDFRLQMKKWHMVKKAWILQSLNYSRECSRGQRVWTAMELVDLKPGHCLLFYPRVLQEMIKCQSQSWNDTAGRAILHYRRHLKEESISQRCCRHLKLLLSQPYSLPTFFAAQRWVSEPGDIIFSQPLKLFPRSVLGLPKVFQHPHVPEKKCS